MQSGIANPLALSMKGGCKTMTAQRIELTRHMKNERIDRGVYISTTVGFGDVIAEKYSSQRKCFLLLTNTGVIFAKSQRTGKLITLYFANINEALFVLDGAVPPYLKNKIKKNEKYSKELEKMEKKM